MQAIIVLMGLFGKSQNRETAMESFRKVPEENFEDYMDAQYRLAVHFFGLFSKERRRQQDEKKGKKNDYPWSDIAKSCIQEVMRARQNVVDVIKKYPEKKDLEGTAERIQAFLDEHKEILLKNGINISGSDCSHNTTSTGNEEVSTVKEEAIISKEYPLYF